MCLRFQTNILPSPTNPWRPSHPTSGLPGGPECGKTRPKYDFAFDLRRKTPPDAKMKRAGNYTIGTSPPPSPPSVVLPTRYFKNAFRDVPRWPWGRRSPPRPFFVVEKTPATLHTRPDTLPNGFLAKRGVKKTGGGKYNKKQVLYTRRTPRRVRTGVNNRVRPGSVDRFPSTLPFEMFQRLAARPRTFHPHGTRTMSRKRCAYIVVIFGGFSVQRPCVKARACRPCRIDSFQTHSEL